MSDDISLLTKDSMEKDDKALGFDGAIGNCGLEEVADLNVSLESGIPAIETEFGTAGILSLSVTNVELFSVDIKFNKDLSEPVSFAFFEQDVLLDISRSEFSACDSKVVILDSELFAFVVFSGEWFKLITQLLSLTGSLFVSLSLSR